MEGGSDDGYPGLRKFILDHIISKVNNNKEDISLNKKQFKKYLENHYSFNNIQSAEFVGKIDAWYDREIREGSELTLPSDYYIKIFLDEIRDRPFGGEPMAGNKMKKKSKKKKTRKKKSKKKKTRKKKTRKKKTRKKKTRKLKKSKKRIMSGG